jgi:PAS domain S-box-containing protein
MFNSWSFRKKLIFLWLTIQLLITGATALLVVESATKSMEKDIVYQSEQIRPVLNSALVTPLIQRDYASVIAILKELVTSENIEEITIKDGNGNVVAKEPLSSNPKNKTDISPYVIEFPILADGISLGKANVAISRVRLVETRSNILVYTGLIGITSLLIFYLLALSISRYITRPISELAVIAKGISQGDFKTHQFTNRNDEIGLLQNAFQSMSAEIARRINDLHLLNADLEKRVQDRTKSLQLARDELIQKIDNLKLLGAVIDKSSFGISIADLKSPGMPLIYVNPAFTEVTGYTAEQTIGTKCRIFQDGITDPDAMNQINLAIENKSACTVEFMDQRQDGEMFWNRLSIFPVIIEDSSPRYYVIFQNDISALKEASTEREVLLQEIQENQRQKSLGVLVAGLAHEINNPIGIALTATTHVSQTAATMRKNIMNLKAAELTEFLEDEEIAFQLIFENLRRASELVRGFKDIASDRSLDEKKEINLRTYIQSIEQSILPVLKKSRCRLTVDIDPSISLQINAGSLGQLITNLVLNATIHAFDGLEDCHIQITGNQTPQYVTLKISDNGNGIPVHVLPNLFTPFFTTSRSKGGTGLGLYISRQIATEVFKGSLSVQNLPDGGCEFTLQILKH